MATFLEVAAMKRTGPWSAAQVARFLRETRVPIRIAANRRSGHPLLASLWYVPMAGGLWCATQRSAAMATLLRRDPRCAFEVSLEAPPYRGVRGAGVATLHDDRAEEVLRTLIDRYLGDANSKLARTLLARVETETAFEIVPQSLASWDYERRMRDGVQPPNPPTPERRSIDE